MGVPFSPRASLCHNLESSPALVRCDLMREGVLRDATSFPLEANGQTSWLIDQAFPAADTSGFAGSVRCDAAGEGRFSAVALEMDPGTGITFANGRFHVADVWDDKVYAYTASGQRDDAADFELYPANGGPVGVTFANDRFYVVDIPDGKVYTYPPPGD